MREEIISLKERMPDLRNHLERKRAERKKY
jgi:hypothetical protein